MDIQYTRCLRFVLVWVHKVLPSEVDSRRTLHDGRIRHLNEDIYFSLSLSISLLSLSLSLSSYKAQDILPPSLQWNNVEWFYPDCTEFAEAALQRHG